MFGSAGWVFSRTGLMSKRTDRNTVGFSECRSLPLFAKRNRVGMTITQEITSLLNMTQ